MGAPYSPRDPVVVLAADNTFVMPMAVAVRSAIDHLATGATLRLFVLDSGISRANKIRLTRSWPVGRYTVEWVHADRSVVASLPAPDRVGRVSYLRLLIPRLLPDEVRRAIYLDCDLVVCADLTRLWEQDCSNNLCLAAQDPSVPYLDAALAIPNFEARGRYVGLPRPIENYSELGLPPTAPYFNAGVMLIDVDGWRKANVTDQLLLCLDRNQEHIRWWDQYALNVVLSGRWGQLDARWNQGAHVFKYPSWEESPFDRLAFEEQRNDPFIVHFTTSKKPWLAGCRHPLRHRFYDVLDCTAWAGWRPAPPGSLTDRVGRLSRRLRF